MTSKPKFERTGGGVPSFERLLVIDDPEARPGPLNMALDEFLLNEGGGVPVLRFYRWLEPTVSFGYFEPAEAARQLAGDRAVVRRLTGGGLVEHGNDLTYTLVVPRSEPFVRVRSVESYRSIHAAVAASLAQGGWQSDSHPEKAAETASKSAVNACFQQPVLHDLVAHGQKIAGGAQRRTRAGLLHQGSVLLADATSPAWTGVLRQLLPAALALRCEERRLTPDEIARAGEIAAAKYATAGWTNRL